MALSKHGVKRLLSVTPQVRSYSAPTERTIPAAKQKYVPTSGTYPQGFLAGSSHAGVKASNTQYDDIALVVSETPCTAGAVITRNLFKAAPVRASTETLRARWSSGIRGVVINSGCANAVTGSQGLKDADKMARAADACLSDQDTSTAPATLVMSTGVIGQRLPIDKITDAIPKAHSALGPEHANWMRAAQAICTTDTFPKLLSRTFTLPSHPETQYSIAGMTKGAGMIHPNMGTLLGVVCTDVSIAPRAIRRMLKYANNASFNNITIDGDTSTNDTVALLANGAAAPPSTSPLDLCGLETKPSATTEGDTGAFLAVLRTFMADLAQLVVRDGEGATKFVTIRVRTTNGYDVAKSAANSIATSALVKTALYGKDANWGRILCAIGYAPEIIGKGRKHFAPDLRWSIPEQTSVSFVPADGSEVLRLLVRGEPQSVDEERAREILEMEDLEIAVDLCDREELRGEEVREAVVWTCDFSHEYVTINGE